MHAHAPGNDEVDLGSIDRSRRVEHVSVFSKASDQRPGGPDGAAVAHSSDKSLWFSGYSSMVQRNSCTVCDMSCSNTSGLPGCLLVACWLWGSQRRTALRDFPLRIAGAVSIILNSVTISLHISVRTCVCF